MLRIRPITEFDILTSNSVEIKHETRSNSQDSLVSLDRTYDVNSKAPYGAQPTTKYKTYEEFNTSTHISMPISVPNVFLAGSKFEVFSKVLRGIDSKLVDGLAVGTYVLEKMGDTFEILPASDIDKDAKYKDNYLIGGDAISYLLDKADPNKDIKEILRDLCRSKVPSLEAVAVYERGNIVFGKSDGLWIIDEYYFETPNEYVKTCVKNKQDEIRDSLVMGSGVTGEFLPEIVALLAFRNNPRSVKDLMLKALPILPIGFRPSTVMRRDPISVEYNKVVRASNNLYEKLLDKSGAKLSAVRTAYKDLFQAYNSLTRNASYFSKHKPLVQILGTKEGALRDKLQATTIDFSGRGVIVVDVNMPVDTIGIPERMALALCELEVMEAMKVDGVNKQKLLSEQYFEERKAIAREIMEKSYVCLGRQPTLYSLGIQGFKVVIVESNAIKLNPIVLPAFNADCDGDQMYVFMPMSKDSKEEVEILMSNVNNLFFPKDGSCNLTPRQEMLYGIYLCYTAEPDDNSTLYTCERATDFENKVYADLKNQNVKITDKCMIAGKAYKTVGYALLKMALGRKEELQEVRLGVVPITTNRSVKEKVPSETFFKEYFKFIRLNYEVGRLLDTIQQFVRIGFTVANMYAPDVDVLHEVDTSDLKEEFYANLSKREELYNLGFELEDSYSLFFNEMYDILDSKMKKRIKETLGKDNGYIQLIESKARGSNSNLLQIFGMKGLMKKDQVDSFDTIIDVALSDQLNGLEHLVTAYGARIGVIDKTIKTFEPGYLSRQGSHVSRHTIIKSKDCGTKEGIRLTYSNLKEFCYTMLTGDSNTDYIMLKEYAVTMLEGRFIVGGGKMALTRKEAEDIFDNRIAKKLTFGGDILEIDSNPVIMRSPLTCEDPCCVQCYGIDLATNKTVVKGTSVGIIASQSIGEPMTQLIMNNFHKGGVSNTKNLTTSYDVIQDFLELIQMDKVASEPITRDLISPVEGTPVIKPINNTHGTLQILDEDGVNRFKSKAIIGLNTPLKEHVDIGDTICLYRGPMDINEVIRYRGVNAAQMYLLFSLYLTFHDQVFVNLKHFEVEVAGMTLKLCLKGNDYFKVGCYYSLSEYYSHNRDGAVFRLVLRGLKQVPKVRTDFFTATFLEDLSRTAMRNSLLSGTDELKDPLVRTCFGLKPRIGTHYEEYLKSRGN